MSESSLVNSIVGPGTYVKGQIEVSGLLRIDGDFSGSVKTEGRLIIGRGGRADCTIDAATVVIGGVFRGTIYATEKVIALETAIILGAVFTPRFIAESGVLIDGAMHVRGPRSESETGAGVADQDQRQRERTETGALASRRGRRRNRNRGVPMGNL